MISGKPSNRAGGSTDWRAVSGSVNEAVRITPGNGDDRKPVPTLVARLFGKLFGDKGYLSAPLRDQLRARD